MKGIRRVGALAHAGQPTSLITLMYMVRSVTDPFPIAEQPIDLSSDRGACVEEFVPSAQPTASFCTMIYGSEKAHGAFGLFDVHAQALVHLGGLWRTSRLGRANQDPPPVNQYDLTYHTFRDIAQYRIETIRPDQ